MKILNASFTTVVMRYYLMMSIVIVAFFIGQPLLAYLALPVFLMAILGVSIDYSAIISTIRKTKMISYDTTIPQVA